VLPTEFTEEEGRSCGGDGMLKGPNLASTSLGLNGTILVARKALLILPLLSA
jgi:hypothetical protein